MTLSVLSWIATVSILVIYFALAKDVRWLRVYLWVNLLGSGILGWLNVAHAIWQNLALNIAFGLISAWGLWHGRLGHQERTRRRLKKRAAALSCEELIPDRWAA